MEGGRRAARRHRAQQCESSACLSVGRSCHESTRLRGGSMVVLATHDGRDVLATAGRHWPCAGWCFRRESDWITWVHGRCAASSRTKRTRWLLYESSRMVVRSVCMCVVGLECERANRWHFLLRSGDDCRKGVAWASVLVVGACACVAQNFFVLGLHGGASVEFTPSW